MEEEKTTCELCGSRWIQYDDHIEYGYGLNEGFHEVSMCSNDKCDNYQ